MRVLISGATGFVGSRTVAILRAQGHELLGVSGTRPQQQALGIDLVERGASFRDRVLEFRPEVIIHAATYFVGQHLASDIDRLLDANIGCGVELLELAQTCESKFVALSSAWQHYEGAVYSPVNLYAATKQALDDIAVFYEDSGVHLDRLTLFDTYGPHDPRRKIVSLLLESAKSGRALTAGSPKNLIDLTYVDDVARAICQVALNDPTQPPIDAVIRSGSLTLGNLVEVMADAIGCDVPVDWDTRGPRPKEMLTDWNFGEGLKGWSPQVSLHEGIQRAWASLGEPDPDGR